MVVVVHECGNESGDGGVVVVVGVQHVPYGVEDVSGGADVALVGGYLEVAHLSIECRRHLMLCERHGKRAEEDDAVNLEVAGEAQRIDDGAWSEVGQCACCDVSVLQVEADVGFSVEDDAKAVVVDDEGRPMLEDEAEKVVVTADDAEFAVEEDIVADLSDVRAEDVAHAREIHQLRLLVHRLSVFVGKDNISW